MINSFSTTQRFIDDFENFSANVNQLRVMASSKFNIYFNGKISDKKNKIFDAKGIPIINELFNIDKTYSFMAVLQSQTFPIHIKDQPLTLRFSINPEQLKVSAVSENISLIPSDQMKYIQELEYAITLAYRINILMDVIQTLRDNLKPLFDAYQTIFLGGNVFEGFENKRAVIEYFVRSTLDMEFLKEALNHLEQLLIYKPNSIEKLLYDAYNKHAQGKGLYQRTWQESVIKPMANEIDPKCTLSKTTFFTSLLYPVLTFPNMDNTMPSNTPSSNKIQNGIIMLMNYMSPTKLNDIHQEFKKYATELLEQDRNISSGIPQQIEFKSRIGNIKERLILQYNKLSALQETKFSRAIDQHHYDLAQLLIKFMVASIRFNKPFQIMPYLDSFDQVCDYITSIAENISLQNKQYCHSDIDNAREIEELLKTFKGPQCLLETPSILDRILAFLHRIIPAFEEQFRKCLKDDLYSESEKHLDEIIRIAPC